MEGFLLLAGLALGVVCLIVGKLQHQGGSAGDAAHGGDDGHLTDSVDIFLVGLGRFDVVGGAFGLDDDLWPIDRHYELSGPFDDLAVGVRATGWPSDAIALDEPNRAVGMDMADDFLVHRICINPATGLPMVSDCEAGFDVGGNPYGFSNDDLCGHHDSLGFGFDSASGSHGSFGSDEWS